MFLLTLSSTFFPSQDVSGLFETSLKRRNALDSRDYNATITDAVSPNVISTSQVYASASRKAIPFGYEDRLRHSHLDHGNAYEHKLADRADPREPITITM